MPSEPADPVRNLLDQAESDLSRRLQEACDVEARGVSSESAEEIRKLEDSLLAAAMAAERVLAARQIADETGQDRPAKNAEATAEPTPRESRPTLTERSGSTEESAGTEHSSVRHFEDESGRAWRAWPVTPDLSRSNDATRRRLGDFHEGWICFEALDNSGRRRLPRLGRRWSDLPADELPRLLEQAIHVPPRKTRH